MSDLFFSVVIPAYNRADLIDATLESVFRQPGGDFEIIVVDDGSTDGTREKLAGYGDRLRVFHQQNQGPATARNLAVRHAAGRYVAFLDSDDLWFPWTLKTYREAIRRHGEPSFIAGTRVDFTSDPVEIAGIAEGVYRDAAFTDYFASSPHEWWIGTCAVAVKAGELNRIGGFVNLRINAEDSDLWMRLGVSPGFVRVHDPPVFAYRRHAASAVSDEARNDAGLAHLLEQEAAGAYPGGSARRRDRLRILARHFRPIALNDAKAGRLARACRLFRQTLAWNLALGRWKYLFGFPLVCVKGLLAPERSGTHQA